MSSKRWLQEHFTDLYVKKANEEGFVSRAAYKLIEINEKDHLFQNGMTIVDLGAAPGGWCQVAMSKIGGSGRVVAVDILPIELVSGIEFIQGDFTEQACLDQLLMRLTDGVDVVLSDMAPNISGNKSVDQPAAVYLVELALDLAIKILKPKGKFVAKIFQGSGVDAVVDSMKKHFKIVKYRKPKSSRSRSAEIYLVGLEFKG